MACTFSHWGKAVGRVAKPSSEDQYSKWVREISGHFRYWAFPCAVQSPRWSPSRKKVQAWASSRVLTPPLRDQGGSDGAGAWPQRAWWLSFPEPHGTPIFTLKQLMCLLVTVTKEKHTLPDSLSSCHAVQSQRFSKHFHFSMLGGGNPIYSLIFHTLRGAVKRPDRGGCHFSGRGSSLLPSLKLYSF